MFKVDLHLHTPASWCYSDHLSPEKPSTSPQDIIKISLSLGLKGIGITDHNSAGWIEKMRKAAKGQIVIFPGVELSAKGGHILALFKEETPIEEMQSLIEEAGFSPQEEGYGHCESSYDMEEVMRMVAERGGLAIAAHIDRRLKGFFASDELSRQQKRRIIFSPFLSAVEITIPQDKSLWNEGRIEGYSRKIACIQGSDAHSPEEIGRRPIYLLIPRLDWEGIILAIKEYETRIKFPFELPMGLPHKLLSDNHYGII